MPRIAILDYHVKVKNDVLFTFANWFLSLNTNCKVKLAYCSRKIV